MIRFLPILVLLASSAGLLNAQATNAPITKREQNAAVNNGTMNQFNITIKPALREQLKVEARQNFGNDAGWLQTIVPGDEPMPEISDCHLPSSAMTILLGGGPALQCTTDECKVLEDHNPGAINPDLLSFRRMGNVIEIHAIVLDDTEKVIAVVDKSKTHANPNNAFDWSRPDKSTIDITDEYNRNVLHLHFANPHLVLVEGLFTNSIGTKATISKDKLALTPRGQGNFTFEGGCLQGGNAYSF